jgi:hypothetical protein
MKKGLIIGLVALLVLAVAVPMALALTDNDKAELEGLYRQAHELRQLILQKQADLGLVDSEKAQAVRERMEQQWEFRQQRMTEGDYSFGKMGRRGFNEGFRMRGGCGNCPVEGPVQSSF